MDALKIQKDLTSDYIYRITKEGSLLEFCTYIERKDSVGYYIKPLPQILKQFNLEIFTNLEFENHEEYLERGLFDASAQYKNLNLFDFYWLAKDKLGDSVDKKTCMETLRECDLVLLTHKEYQSLKTTPWSHNDYIDYVIEVERPFEKNFKDNSLLLNIQPEKPTQKILEFSRANQIHKHKKKAPPVSDFEQKLNNLLQEPEVQQAIKNPNDITVKELFSVLENLEDKKRIVEISAKVDALGDEIVKKTQQLIKNNFDIPQNVGKVSIRTIQNTYKTTGANGTEPITKTNTYLCASWYDGKRRTRSLNLNQTENENKRTR